MKKRNGYLYDETTIATGGDAISHPYIILYNKYTGILRVITSYDEDLGNYDKVNIILRLRDSYSGVTLKKTNLLANNNSVSRPLDQTKIAEVAVPSGLPQHHQFFYADFQTSYDPCNCLNRSELVVDTEFIENTSIINMEGRFIGTDVPLNASGNSPLLNDKDFLLAVFRDENFSINGGALTYNNIDKLVDEYKKPRPLTTAEQIGIDAAKALIKGVGSGLDDFIGSKIILPIPIDASKFDKFVGDTYNDAAKGFGLFGAGANFLTTKIDEAYAVPKVPNIGFIEGEMALTGTLTDVDGYQADEIIIDQPGSSASLSGTNWTAYPTYNETLGIFAMLERPKVVMDYGANGYKKFVYQGKTLKYTLNPAADINMEKSEVLIALRILSKVHESIHTTVEGVDYIGEHQCKHNGNPLTGSIFQTPYVKPNVLSVFSPVLTHLNDWAIDKVYLSVMLKLVFNENKYGVENKAVRVLTYPVQLITLEEIAVDHEDYSWCGYDECGSIDLRNHDDGTLIPESEYNSWFEWHFTGAEDLDIEDKTIGTKNYASNHVERSIQSIKLIGNVTVASGKHVNFNAGDKIIIDKGASIDKNATFSVGAPLSNGVSVNPVSFSEVRNFCNSSKYKAY